MGASETGVTGYIHGHAGLTSTSFDTTKCQIIGDLALKQIAALKNEIKNGAGVVITRRRDDITKTLPVTLKVKSTFTALGIGATVTIADTTRTEFNGTYEVEDIGTVLKQGEYADYQVNLIDSEGITQS